MKSIVVLNLLYIIYPEHFKFSQQQNILQADLTKPQITIGVCTKVQVWCYLAGLEQSLTIAKFIPTVYIMWLYSPQFLKFNNWIEPDWYLKLGQFFRLVQKYMNVILKCVGV